MDKTINKNEIKEALAKQKTKKDEDEIKIYINLLEKKKKKIFTDTYRFSVCAIYSMQ